MGQLFLFLDTILEILLRVFLYYLKTQILLQYLLHWSRQILKRDQAYNLLNMCQNKNGHERPTTLE